MTKAERRAAVQIALKAVKARNEGKTSVKLGKQGAEQVFDLVTAGYCARFVRQCYEAGNGLKPMSWEFKGKDAVDMGYKLMSAGKLVKEGLDGLEPGDVIVDACAGIHGHVVLVVRKRDDGVWEIAENTSSTRGNPKAPGTKLSTLGEFLTSEARKRRVKVYRP